MKLDYESVSSTKQDRPPLLAALAGLCTVAACIFEVLLLAEGRPLLLSFAVLGIVAAGAQLCRPNKRRVRYAMVVLIMLCAAAAIGVFI